MATTTRDYFPLRRPLLRSPGIAVSPPSSWKTWTQGCARYRRRCCEWLEPETSSWGTPWRTTSRPSRWCTSDASTRRCCTHTPRKADARRYATLFPCKSRNVLGCSRCFAFSRVIWDDASRASATRVCELDEFWHSLAGNNVVRRVVAVNAVYGQVRFGKWTACY